MLPTRCPLLPLCSLSTLLPLSLLTAPAVQVFVNDDCSAETLHVLKDLRQLRLHEHTHRARWAPGTPDRREAHPAAAGCTPLQAHMCIHDTTACQLGLSLPPVLRPAVRRFHHLREQRVGGLVDESLEVLNGRLVVQVQRELGLQLRE
jgi:hypothetical protein